MTTSPRTTLHPLANTGGIRTSSGRFLVENQLFFRAPCSTKTNDPLRYRTLVAVRAPIPCTADQSVVTDAHREGSTRRFDTQTARDTADDDDDDAGTRSSSSGYQNPDDVVGQLGPSLAELVTLLAAAALPALVTDFESPHTGLALAVTLSALGVATADIPDVVASLLGCSPTACRRWLVAIDRTHGSTTRFLLRAGAEPNTIGELRFRLVER